MKRTALYAALWLTLSIGTASARHDAADEYDDSMMHPLRLAGYLAHPAGYAVEWLIGRPLHYIISRPYLDRIFGYQPLEEEAREQGM